MAPARIILLIALTGAKNKTHLLVSTLNSLHNYFYGAIYSNDLLPRKEHFI